MHKRDFISRHPNDVVAFNCTDQKIKRIAMDGEASYHTSKVTYIKNTYESLVIIRESTCNSWLLMQ